MSDMSDMPDSASARAHIHGQVVCTPHDDEGAVLMHTGTRTCCTLNATAKLIWDQLELGKTIAQAACALAAAFEVEPADANRAVITLCEELVSAKFIRLEPSDGDGDPGLASPQTAGTKPD